MKSTYNLVHYLLYSELLLLGIFYVWSPHGVQAITKLQREQQEVVAHVERLKKDIASLEHEIVEWESDAFYKEKIAREQLQMARRSDVVYYLLENNTSKS